MVENPNKKLAKHIFLNFYNGSFIKEYFSLPEIGARVNSIVHSN